MDWAELQYERVKMIPSQPVEPSDDNLRPPTTSVMAEFDKTSEKHRKKLSKKQEQIYAF